MLSGGESVTACRRCTGALWPSSARKSCPLGATDRLAGHGANGHTAGRGNSCCLPGARDRDVISGGQRSISSPRTQASGGVLVGSGTSWYLPFGAWLCGRRGIPAALCRRQSRWWSARAVQGASWLPPAQRRVWRPGDHDRDWHVFAPGPHSVSHVKDHSRSHPGSGNSCHFPGVQGF